ncbi:MAG: shikimate kinase [Lachnospiraceae bacterium]
MTNIILIGFMGCGKTTFGKWLSDRQQMDFVDTDEFIEKLEGRSISDIFATDGEEYFRNLETRVLKMFLGEEDDKYTITKSTVISVGGGLPVREENQKLLHKLGKTIFLDTSVDELLRRLSGDETRPLLKGEDLRTKIQNLMDARIDIYDDTADIVVETDGKSLFEIYETIMKEYNNL